MFFTVCLLYFVVPYFLPVQLKNIPHSTLLYDKNNVVIGEIIADDMYRHQNLDLSLYPKFLVQSLIAIEDRRFWKHNGIDWIALCRAVLFNIQSDSIQWASTITSQIARNQLWLNEPRKAWRKIVEFFYAYILDVKYSKENLLSHYLNTMPLWYMTYGFESAAQRYFWKSLYQLSQSQQLALLVIMKNSVRYDPFKKRSNFDTRYLSLVSFLKDRGYISLEEADALSIDLNTLDWKTNEDSLQPYVRDYIKQQSVVNNIQLLPEMYTTIDDALSREVKSIADESIYKLLWKNVSDYSILVIDRKTHELRVMLGGIDYNGKYGKVNATMSINQPGSAVKPFTYALAFEQLGLDPSDTIIDEPVQFQSALWFAYTPQNFSMTYEWPVTMAQALAQSLNVPAVKIAHMLGVDNLLSFYREVWLDSLTQSADHYWLALTLGVGEVSLWEMARAYGVFAYQWQLCSIAVFSWQAITCKDVIDPTYSNMVVDILSNRYNKMPSFPLFSNVDFPDRNVFLKSWTSRKFSDNWMIWFTDNYIVAIWIGNKDGSNMKWVSGVAGAGDIFNKIVYLLEKNNITPSYVPQKSAVVEPYLHITKPLAKTVFMIDSKISPDLQWLKFDFSTNIPYTHYQWMLDSDIVSTPIWVPTQGFHTATITLFSGDVVLENREVSFEVRK